MTKDVCNEESSVPVNFRVIVWPAYPEEVEGLLHVAGRSGRAGYASSTPPEVGNLATPLAMS
jgi:hypothetical protein